jgi:hypothetical protein
MLALFVGMATAQAQNVPPRVRQAHKFLAERGWTAVHSPAPRTRVRQAILRPMPASTESPATAAWQPLGPAAVSTSTYGPVSGRVSAIAFDPADATGNRVYLGTTGGGVWVSQNAGTSSASSVVFAHLTDTLAALSGAHEPSISIGAIAVQPGGTGVILAGTGDPNDALDSYYGAGILRSTDGGTSWKLIQATGDQLYGLIGEGFSGFAWSTTDLQLVVAALSQAAEGELVDAEEPDVSYAGLYYSTDAGATWYLAQVTDPGGADVQGTFDAFASPHGNAATSVVWNPVRHVFVAAVRYHGYYQSTDGMRWTRLSAQPGTGFSTLICPTNPASIGSVACPIFRGTLAVNPLSGDTFAWTVDANNQDQGIWQDLCAISAGTCTNSTIGFSKQLNTAALETDVPLQGAATVANGDYNLALAAVPSGQDTLLLAGANDLWKCSLAVGCAWRNTTNATTCMSAQVAGYQHALAWNTANPLEIFLGNDSGLWRSMDGVGETGAACAPTDAGHFQNLNSGLGSLAEVVSMSSVLNSPYTMMTGLGINGTAGVKSTTGPTAVWPQILGGEGGPVAIDPANNSNWYVNDQAGVSIHLCSQSSECTPSNFGLTPVVSEANVSGDGYTMTEPAPFLVDPLDPTQLLIGTCRVWRGPANGSGWSAANAVSPFLDGVTGQSTCRGDALIRSITAMVLGGGGEVVYVGMLGAFDGGANRAGHVFRGVLNGAGTWSAWRDLTLNTVNNDPMGMNAYGLDISSIFIDPHDSTGNTVYVTVEGVNNPTRAVQVAYRSIDGGAHWVTIASNLPFSPANSLVVDPQDASTAYIATDAGVFSTRQIASCATAGFNCWSAYGTGLPAAPVVELSAAPASSSLNVLAAATYGRGVWQVPLWTADTQVTSALANPANLIFADQANGTSSGAQTVTVTNTGGIALTPTAIAVSGDFSETDHCVNTAVNAGANCALQVTFSPTQTGSRMGQLTLSANVAGGQLTVALSGNAIGAGSVVVAPSALNFGDVETGSTSSALQVTLENSGSTAIPIMSVNVSGPFALANNGCGSSLAANSDCALALTFAPTQGGAATGTLTLVESGGTETVQLSGIGLSPPSDSLSPSALTFSGTATGATSPAQTVTLTNSGGVALTSISVSAKGPFQVTSNCGTQLAGGSSCALSVTFVPTGAGAQTGTLSVSDLLKTQTVSLSGTGWLPPAIGVNPGSLSFPSQQVGMPGAPLTLTASNTGGAPMSNVGFQITGPSAGSFSIGTSTCGAVLASGSSCTVQVIFAPAATGANSATLTVSSATLGVKAANVALSGTGTAASGLNVIPGQMTFAEAVLGQSSPAQTATITNTSGLNATGLLLVATGPFSLTQNNCGTSLGGGASCSAQIVFTPTVNGTVQGALTVGASSLNTATAVLSGIGGLAGAVQLQPGSVSFSPTGVGTTSGAQTVAVTNASAVALSNLALTISDGFQLGGSTCTTSLPPAASCTVSVVFAPAGAGQRTGNLTVASSSLASNVQAPLSGMGTDFTASFSGSSSQTVASGQTASYALQLTPMNGSAGTFSFQCASLPANAACVFNPSSETVAANSTGSATVQIATGRSGSSARNAGLGLGAAAPLACGLMLVPLAWGRRRRGFLLVLLGLLMMGGIASCSGSGGGTGGAPPGSGGANTPAGTYSIQVAVLSNGVSHAVTLSLTVD